MKIMKYIVCAALILGFVGVASSASAQKCHDLTTKYAEQIVCIPVNSPNMFCDIENTCVLDQKGLLREVGDCGIIRVPCNRPDCQASTEEKECCCMLPGGRAPLDEYPGPF
jgi:hypothetical protein